MTTCRQKGSSVVMNPWKIISAIPLSSTEHFSVFKFNVLVYQHASFLFWFTHTTLNVVSSHRKRLISVQKL